MGQKGGVPQEERLVLLECVIDKCLNRFHAGTADFEAVVSMASTGLGEAASHAVGEAASAEVAFPVFAALVAEVALFAEKFREGVEFVDIGDERGAALFVEVGVALGILGGGVVACCPVVLVGFGPCRSGVGCYLGIELDCVVE